MKTLLAGISLLALIALTSTTFGQSTESKMPNPKNTELKATRAAENAVIRPNEGIITSSPQSKESVPATETKAQQAATTTPVKTRSETVAAPKDAPKQ